MLGAIVHFLEQELAQNDESRFGELGGGSLYVRLYWLQA